MDRSFTHFLLFAEVRRALPEAFVDLAFFSPSSPESLAGLDSGRLLQDFDLVLLSNAYTLELVNLPWILQRSGLSLFAGEREQGPILLLGGSNAMAAQAVIRPDGDSMVDGIFFGEGEG
ncbi:MAG: hypothetical protein D6793_04865, partial [Thermoflexia bacterium]